VDDGTGGGAANNLVQDGSEPLLLSGNLQPGNTFDATKAGHLPDVAGSGRNIEFNPRGTPATIGGVQTVGFIDIVGSAGSAVQYRVRVNLAGHVTLTVSTDGGTNFQ
jgi:hypothetical protein